VKQLLADAKAVQDAGAFAVVLEMVPADAARQVTELLEIPTISVGAGPHTDGQLLVWTDWAGLTIGRVPKFVKQYADLSGILSAAAKEWRTDVESGTYPNAEHSYE
jgi:3-methyl-2-oxobutanoate hydroxymethyltransferase